MNSCRSAGGFIQPYNSYSALGSMLYIGHGVDDFKLFKLTCTAVGIYTADLTLLAERMAYWYYYFS